MIENILSGLAGAIIGFAGSCYVYFHAQKSRYKLELMSKIDFIEFELKYSNPNEVNVFRFFMKEYLSLLDSYNALLTFNVLNRSILKEGWRKFKGQKLESYRAGSDAFMLPTDRDDAFKRINEFRLILQII